MEDRGSALQLWPKMHVAMNPDIKIQIVQDL